MRHKYETRGIVLARSTMGEANASVVVLTPALGLVRARAQGLRKSGAKLSAALVTFAESDLVLVEGKEGWRVAGAVLMENWFRKMQQPEARATAARVSGLVLRLVAGEAHDAELHPIIRSFFDALITISEDQHEAAELLVVIRVLAALGLDAGEIPGHNDEFTPEILNYVLANRANYIARINHGISASGL
ncbi:hypothetical protein A3G63_01110 [Candidatus Kaiserbacteria bacterium RIFCSPLOWO2_12_FULL_52_8]|uniref:DNA replication/recombination mediator RecO N-terminal domain-containing protein n=1 Tax=Candidatus Kaiserbacteria bacterium RIFCSPHIGHO2_01_FULL_53_31 TaxID=1798481 RepID=A0A1F6CJV5_9BACT|nr:MAG: hypothetical protein A2678_00855 [Candidatus Kaiserbacteria bacterium RIFCSPHIGHO2_01_FULL_53_31]OGG94534.1 MAG: hypothetical protein A3G63_01110 [Candidatus Kaiserbacteria bacterium RIFCSPLOWO2_12_FULL_52_8]